MRRWKIQQGKTVRILGTEILGAIALFSLLLASGALRPHSVDRKSTRLNSSHSIASRMPSSA